MEFLFEREEPAAEFALPWYTANLEFHIKQPALDGWDLVYVLSESKKVIDRLEHPEDQVDVLKSTFESVTKIAESIVKGKQKPSNMKFKPVSEFKAMQQLKTFGGDRSKFRTWNDTFCIAPAKINNGIRKALKNLRSQLEAPGCYRNQINMASCCCYFGDSWARTPITPPP